MESELSLIYFLFPRRSLSHSDVAINLIGKLVETRNFSYRDVNVEGPARLARIAREMGVERFFHISHVNARENPDVREDKIFLTLLKHFELFFLVNG